MPMLQYEYDHLEIDEIPQEIIIQYKLGGKVDAKGYALIKIQKGYQLPQADILAQELLKETQCPQLSTECSDFGIGDLCCLFHQLHSCCFQFQHKLC